MNIVAKNVASKLFVAIVAAAMLLSVAAPAKAATVEELQAQIAALMAQISGLSGGAATSAGACTFTRALTVGSQGEDVKCLQMYLTPMYFTNAGGATGYFGSVTASAVAAWQSANGVTPASGYFGPISQAKYNALMATTGGGSGSDDSDDDSSSGLSGEASLDTADLEDGESSVEEGDEEVVVGVFTAEFQDGDAEISRLDVAFANGSAEPWEAFESVSLLVDGEEVASMDVTDEDDYLDEDAGELRFSGLDIVAMEDEEIEIEIAVSVQNNLDSAELGDWTVEVTSLRFFDADGVATTESGSSAPFDGETSEFEVEVAGAGEELKISLATSNPDASDVVVDTDVDTNDVTVLVAELEAEDNDIELGDLVVRVVTTATTTNVVDEVRVVIDGESFKAEALGTEADDDASANGSGNGLTEGYSEVDASAVSGALAIWYYFDLDGDVTLADGEEVEMEVVVDLNDTDDADRYDNGTTIKAEITSVERVEWSAEGAEDLDPSTQINGTAVGDTHTLVAEGILVPVSGFSFEVETLGENDNIGEFTLEFEVEAVEGDFYITENATTSTAVTNGVVFAVDGGSATISGTLTSTADEDTSGVFTVREGETETFTLTVTVDPAATGAFRVTLSEIWYTENTNGTSSTEDYLPTPASDYRTSSQTIQGS
jgi:peptidoglycan hydrolase-like protein with peptidoglycan-binding domain